MLGGAAYSNAWMTGRKAAFTAAAMLAPGCAHEALQTPELVDNADTAAIVFSGLRNHPIGVVDHKIISITRDEVFTDNPEDSRTIIATIWYPAAGADGARAIYFSEAAAFESVYDTATINALGRVRLPAVDHATASRDAPSPVVILSPGWGASRHVQSMFAMDMVGRGYVAVVVDHPYLNRVAIDGAAPTEPSEGAFDSFETYAGYLGDDLSDVVDMLERMNRDPDSVLYGALDLNRVVSVGHSSGYLATFAFCQTDKRCRASATIDGGGVPPQFLGDLRVPLLWVRLERMGAPSADLPAKAAALIEPVIIEGANHSSISDWDYIDAASDSERSAAAGKVDEIAAAVADFENRHHAAITKPSGPKGENGS